MRPALVEGRRQLGHWEIDTIAGGKDPANALTLVEHKTGDVLIGALRSKTAAALGRRTIAPVRTQCPNVGTSTADNGSEMGGFREIAQHAEADFCFAHPDCAWQRDPDEDTSGRVRQSLLKRRWIAGLTQRDCMVIARRFNTRPRKRLGYIKPEECCGGKP